MNKNSLGHRGKGSRRALNASFAVMIGTGLVAVTACQDAAVEAPSGASGGDFVSVKLPNLSAPSATDAGVTVELFHFSRQMLKGKVTVTVPQTDPVTLEKEEESRIYALSGYSIDTKVADSGEELFAHTLIQSPEGAQSAPMFFSGVAELDIAEDDLSVPLTRGVARIDVNNTDAGLQIKSVTVSDAAAASYIFPLEESVCESNVVTYSRDFEGIRGLEKGVITLFESANPATVTITGTSDGEPVEIVMKTPAVKRNKVYTVTLTPTDPNQTATVKGTITVADWEEGDDYNPGPDTSHGIMLDIAASAFPANVKYDEVTGIVDVPAEGLEDLRLAFRSDLRIDIDNFTLSGEWVEKDSLADRGAFTINNYKVTESGNDIITTYSVKIKPQLICRSEYLIDLGVRKASMVSVYDHVRIRVAPHPKQIHTVKMAGMEWMCFNATSKNLEDQIFPLEGVSVEEMYNEHYVDCVGNYFQYGKENPFSPWTSNNPNQFADQPRDIPWKTEGRMPLPEGYHVSSAAEWKALMPNGIVLPASWMTASGDSIKGSLVTLPGTLETPSAATNKKNFKMRYVLLESVTTGNKLYVPLAGIKPNNTAEVPGHGNLGFDLRTSYWLADDRYCWLIDYKATADKEDGAAASQNRWNYDGFMLVRGVKDSN